MLLKSKYVLNEFAEIYEQTNPIEYDLMYYINRDNFYEVNRSWLKHGYMSREELRNKFKRPPKIENKRDYEFAAANAMFYLNSLGCNQVDWVEEALKNCSSSDNKPYHNYSTDVEEEKRNTPEEFKKFGFIMHKKHLEIR